MGEEEGQHFPGQGLVCSSFSSCNPELEGEGQEAPGLGWGGGRGRSALEEGTRARLSLYFTLWPDPRTPEMGENQQGKRRFAACVQLE